MNLPMTPKALSIPAAASTATAASAVPVHQRRAGERPRLIQARTAHRLSGRVDGAAVAASRVHRFCPAVSPDA
jgi:hypothetical protein